MIRKSRSSKLLLLLQIFIQDKKYFNNMYNKNYKKKDILMR